MLGDPQCCACPHVTVCTLHCRGHGLVHVYRLLILTYLSLAILSCESSWAGARRVTFCSGTSASVQTVAGWRGGAGCVTDTVRRNAYHKVLTVIGKETVVPSVPLSTLAVLLATCCINLTRALIEAVVVPTWKNCTYGDSRINV